MILSRALDLDLTAADQATIVGRQQVEAARSVREVAGDLGRAGRSGDAYWVCVVAAVLEVVVGGIGRTVEVAGARRSCARRRVLADDDVAKVQRRPSTS